MHTATIKEFQAHALTPASVERMPTMLCLPSAMLRGVHNTFGVTRDPAAELFGTGLFQHDVCTLSVSAHDQDGQKVGIDLADVLTGLSRLLGEEILPTLRIVSLIAHSPVTYFKALVDGDRFYAPSPFQDAFMAREYRSLRPALAPLP